MARKATAPVDPVEPHPFGVGLSIGSQPVLDPETGETLITGDGRLLHSPNHGWYNLPTCQRRDHRSWWRDYYGNVGCADCCAPLPVCVAEMIPRPISSEIRRRYAEGRRILAMVGI